jgi:hypothetical protein
VLLACKHPDCQWSMESYLWSHNAWEIRKRHEDEPHKAPACEPHDEPVLVSDLAT